MRHPRLWSLLTGGLMVTAVLVLVLFPERFTALSPYYMAERPVITMGAPPFPPSAEHLLGTDVWGRDMWSRIVYGARWSVLYATLIAGARLLLAIPLGGLAAFEPRLAGWLVERLYVATSAIPPLLIYLLVLGLPALRVLALVPSVVLVVSLLTVMEWPRIAMVVRGRLEALSREEFVLGAVAVGATRWRIFRVHLMPHLWPVLMHMTAAEMGRALLVIAQLGLFQIFVGGGIVEWIDIDGGGTQRPVVISGIPEWGSELADARRHLVWKPWVAMAPASAFLLGVVGFNLLAQGLEGVRFSTARWREATTGRLSPRWRWAVPALLLPALVWIYGGLPWGREAALRALVATQQQALRQGDLAAYLATLDPAAASYRSERGDWAERVMALGAEFLIPTLSEIEVVGSRATVRVRLVVAGDELPAKVYDHKVSLVRRWGRWYEQGEAFQRLRGRHVDVITVYDPLDTSMGAAHQRRAYRLIATAADRGYLQMDPLIPAHGPKERPVIKLYPSHQAYLDSFGTPPEGLTTSFYKPGEVIRVSPLLLDGLKRWQIQQELSFELLKQMIESRDASPEWLPLALGLGEIAREEGPYRLQFGNLSGGPLLSLSALLEGNVVQMARTEMRLYMVQLAMLVQFLEQELGRQKLMALAADGAPISEALQQATGRHLTHLAAGYEQYVLEQIRALSVLRTESGRERIPETVLRSLEARAAAAVSGPHQGFLDWQAVGLRDRQRLWLEQARAAGLTGYQVELLDMDPIKRGENGLFVLERLTFADGRVIAGVVQQQWIQDSTGAGERWVATWAPSPFVPPYGR